MSSLEIRVCGRYKLQDKLYEGKRSTVYSGRNVQSDTDCAIKCEPKIVKPSFLSNEGKVLEEIQGGVGIPNLLWQGQNGDFYFVITELLGTSLEDYLQLCEGKFSLKTVLMIADKIISSLEFIHYKSFVHRNIEPSNFLMGLGKKLHQIYTIDYAIATPYTTFLDNSGDISSEKKHQIDNMSNTDNVVGASKFASLNVLQGHRHSRRDDLESLGLMLIYFLKGTLPWSNPESDLSAKQIRKEIRKKMEGTPLEQLCFGIPKQFHTFMQYCRNLRFQEAPDYNYLKRLFKEKLIKEGYQYDHIFDWILLPLRLKDTRLSNRIPLNRIPKKEPADPALVNSEANFKEDFDSLEELLRLRKQPREEKEKKEKNTVQVQDSRVRSNSTRQKGFSKPQPTKKGKDDCLIY